MSSSQSSSFMNFLTSNLRKRNASAQPAEANRAQLEAVEDLAAELAALDTLQLRFQMLEERKSAGKYKGVFAAEASIKDAIMVDEVNSGQHNDAVAAPAGAAAGNEMSSAETLTLKLVPEYDEITNQELTFKAVVSIKATADVEKPANVALMAVVDKSGSMQGQKIDLVKDTVEFLAEQLGDKDALGLITYSDSAKRDLPMMLMTPAAKTLSKAVSTRIRADGCTALHDGLLMAVKEHRSVVKAADNADTRRIRSIFLCTDGLPNIGLSDAPSIVSAMRAQLAPLAAADEPVSVNTFGFGSDHDPKLLQAIAEAGGGIYYYIQNDRQIPEAFGDALGGLLSVVASNVRINITAETTAGEVVINKVQSGGVIESTPDAKKQACVKFADLFADESREVLLELQLPPVQQQDEHMQPVVKVEVTYTNPVTGAVVNTSQVLQVSRSASPPADPKRHELVGMTVARFQVAEAVKAAGAESDAGRYDGAEQLLEEAKKKIQQEGAGDSEWVFVEQLNDMTNALKEAKLARSAHHRSAVSAGLASVSNAMSHQRSAAPDFGGMAHAQAYAVAPAFGAGWVGPFAAAIGPSCGAPAGASNAQSHAGVQFLTSSNAMRQHMSSTAADYVAKKSRK